MPRATFLILLLAAACTTPVPFPAEAILVANGGDGTLTVIDAKNDTVLGVIELDEDLSPHHLSLSPNGRTVIVSAFEGQGQGSEGARSTLFFINSVSGEIDDELPIEGTAHNAIFTGDGKLVVHAVRETNKVRVVEPQTGTVVVDIDVGEGPLEVTLAPDARRAFVASSAGNSVTLVDLGELAKIATVPVGQSPTAAWIGADGKGYVTNAISEDISVIDLSDGHEVARIAVGGLPGQALTRADGKLLYVANEENQRVQVFSVPGYTLSASIEAGKKPHGLALSRDGSKLYVTDEADAKVLVIDTGSRKVVGSIAVGPNPRGVMFWKAP